MTFLFSSLISLLLSNFFIHEGRGVRDPGEVHGIIVIIITIQFSLSRFLFFFCFDFILWIFIIIISFISLSSRYFWRPCYYFGSGKKQGSSTESVPGGFWFQINVRIKCFKHRGRVFSFFHRSFFLFLAPAEGSNPAGKTFYPCRASCMCRKEVWLEPSAGARIIIKKRKHHPLIFKKNQK